ncbi:hypothetical protein QFC19_003431 [Naganishia cerealis]|uniref:Uncharacterized protein n=1 Tax=Naganishia cerealis TaxID=610337 RepID=A0ACC2W361_9TREE|nr:hypothetical protein QFC19_003431 [Naganishia cerealis]
MTVGATDIAAAEEEIVQEHQLREKIINEEFKIWKKTVPLLYDTIHSQALDFPSLSIAWLPDYTVSDNKNFITVKFLYGTNTSQHSQDYLKLGSLQLPSTLAPDFASFNPNAQSIPIPVGDSTTDFKAVSSWKHNGEINKIRLSPDASSAITFDNSGDVHLYDLSAVNKPPTSFVYHKQEGYALEWVLNDRFLSGANDSQIVLWDVSKPLTPLQAFKSHTAVINDLSHSVPSQHLFGSVADDYWTHIHDLRSSVNDGPAIKTQTSHVQNAISFHPQIATLYAVAGKDKVVNVYDLRNPNEPFRKLFGHTESVAGVQWNLDSEPELLTSWGYDRRVITWNLAALNEDFSYPDSEEGGRKRAAKSADPCLYFIHGGHTGRVNDVSIHPKIPSLYATCGDDSLLEVYRTKTVREDTDNEEEAEKEDNDNDEKKDVEMEENDQ